MEKTIIFPGTASQKLSKDIVVKTKSKIGKLEIGRFSDGEIDVWIPEKVSGQEVVIVQSTAPPVNDNLVELCLIADALRRSYAKRITAVIPYFGYSRKDKLSRSGEPLSAKVAMDFLVSAGINRILTVDLHSKPVVGFANIPVVEVSAISLFARRFKKLDSQAAVFAPDAGGVKRARDLGKILDVPVGFVEKDRSVSERDRVEVLTCNGAVKGRNIILIDDIVSTGGTLMGAAKFLKSEGAKTISVCVTHAIFSEESQIELQKSEIDEFFITNSTNIKIIPSFKKAKIIDLSGLLAESL